MANTRNEEAVAPVIGIVLMVAVTVILAAIIGSYVFGHTESVQKTKVVAATAQLTTTGYIDIVYQGGQDTDQLKSISITAPNGTIWYTSSTDGALTVGIPSSSVPAKKPDIGAAMMLHPTSPPDWPLGQKHVLVTGTFNDGASQIILNTYV